MPPETGPLGVSGVVNEEIDPSERVDASLGELAAVGIFADVGLAQDGLAAGFLDQLLGLVGAIDGFRVWDRAMKEEKGISPGEPRRGRRRSTSYS